MMRSFMNRQFLGFLLTGGLAAAVNFGSRIVYNRWLDFSSAVVLAYLTGMVTAFILARSFVFTQSSQSVQRSAMFFVLVHGAVLPTAHCGRHEMGARNRACRWCSGARIYQLPRTQEVFLQMKSYISRKRQP